MHRFTRIQLLLTFVTLSVSLAVAQDATYVQITGILGESIDASHVDWIDAFGIDESYAFTGGTRTIEDVAILKGTDRATTALYQRLLEGTVLDQVKIEVCRTAAPQECYYLIELQGARVTSASLAGSACIDPSTSCTPPQTESITFAFEQIHWTYTMWVEGSKQGTYEYCWDTTLNTMCP